MSITFASAPAEKAQLEEGSAFTPRFDAHGLVTAVVTDAGDGQLLMVAHMNAEALARTLETGIAHYWSRSRGEFRQRVIRQLEKIGIRDVDKRLRCEQIVTPADWDQGHEIYRGATFNLAHNLGQLLHLRPQNRFEDLAGVYLVGGGTHPGSGLPVIFESARITARLLLEDLDVSTELTEHSQLSPRSATPDLSKCHDVLEPATALSVCLPSESAVLPESL